MLYFTKHKYDCTGCGACKAACPLGCISMEEDNEGFLYPVASEQCVRCKRCESVCPLADAEKTFSEQPQRQTAACVLTNDKALWQKSASGGAFSEICRLFGEDAVICGAAWDGFRVHHICVEGIREISPLRKSKYIASNTEDVFSQIKNYLKDGRNVIFCGTPCQVAGLKRYLEKKYENLLLIDLICHGVGSPAVFKSCVESLSEQFRATVTAYEFRAKKNERKENDVLYIKNDPYIQLFLSQNILRPSCGEHCRFRRSDRQGDITLADFKGLACVFPELNGSDKNYSSVVANSEKGHQILERLKDTVHSYACEVSDIERYNPLFSSQTWFSKDRERFFSDFQTDPAAAIEQWAKPAIVFRSDESVKHRAWRMFPKSMKRPVLKMIGIIKGKAVMMESEYSSCGISKITLKKDVTYESK